MASDEEVLQYFDLSLEFIGGSKGSFEKGYLEPALFCGIHALELAVKAVLLIEVEEPIYTHNVGGKLGRFYRDEYGEDTCRRINQILRLYNNPRYPGPERTDPEDAEEIIDFIGDFIETNVRSTLRRKGLI